MSASPPIADMVQQITMTALCQERTSVATRSLRQRGREMIDLLAVEEPKPAKMRAVSYEAAIDQLFKRSG